MKKEIRESEFLFDKLYNDEDNGYKADSTKYISIKKLKRHYHLKTRDIEVLVKFLVTYRIAFFEDELCCEMFDEDGNEIDIEEYCEKLKEIGQIIAVLMKQMGNDGGILLKKNFGMILKRKERMEFAQKLNSFHNMNENLDDNKKLDELLDVFWIKNRTKAVLIDKSEMSGRMKKHILDITQGIMENRKVTINHQDNTVAIGMYYDAFLQKDFVVCKSFHEKFTICVNDIQAIQVSKESYEETDFDVAEYRESVNKFKMVVKVFDEAKVIEKLKILLKDNKVTYEDYDGYSIFEFYTNDVELYAEKLRQHGRSVLIIEPRNIMEKIMGEIQEALKEYQ